MSVGPALLAQLLQHHLPLGCSSWPHIAKACCFWARQASCRFSRCSSSPLNRLWVGLAAGTSLRYRPGLVMGGQGFVHDCGRSRGIGYFLEPLVCMSLFANKVSNSSSSGVVLPPGCLHQESNMHVCILLSANKASSCLAWPLAVQSSVP